MIHEMVAVKLKDEEGYTDLMRQGFVLGSVVKCSKCDCEYRLLYRAGVPDVMAQAVEATSFENVVENSHPNHPERVLSSVLV